MATPPAFAATGDLVTALTFSQNCSSGLGVGITFDGTNLWVSCYNSGAANPDLLRVDPATGTVTYSTNVAAGLGSLAYDSSRNVIWAGEGVGSFTGSVIKIPLTAGPTRTVSGPFIPGFPVPQAKAGGCGTLDDGLGIDLADPAFPLGVLYVSYDCSHSIFKYNADTGAFITSFAQAPGITALGSYNSGVAIGGQLLYEGSDGSSHVFVVDKTTLVSQFDFTTVVAGDVNFRDESLTCDTNTFFKSLGKHVMWSKEAFSPNRAHAYEIPLNTCGSGGMAAGACSSGDAVLVNEVFHAPGTLTYDVSSPTRILSSIMFVASASTNIGSFTLPAIAAGGHSATGGVFNKADTTKKATFTLKMTFVSPVFSCTIDPVIRKGKKHGHDRDDRDRWMDEK